MTLAVARIGDTFADTGFGVDTIATGSPDVFINNKPVAREGDTTTGHSGPPPHGFYPPAAIITGSSLFFANNKPVARLTDTHASHCDVNVNGSVDCHTAPIDVGAGNVFCG